MNRGLFRVTRIGVEVECVEINGSMLDGAPQKFYYPLSETPQIEVNDLVSAASGSTWDRLSCVSPEVQHLADLFTAPPKLPLSEDHSDRPEEGFSPSD